MLNGWHGVTNFEDTYGEHVLCQRAWQTGKRLQLLSQAKHAEYQALPDEGRKHPSYVSRVNGVDGIYPLYASWAGKSLTEATISL